MNGNSNNKKKKKNILSGNLTKIVALCLFSLAVVSISLASYTTQDKGSDQSRVASFDVSAVDMSGWNYQLTELFCRYDISEDIDDGEYQYLAYKVEVRSNSEVDVEYTVNGINFPKSLPDFVEVLLLDGVNLDDSVYPIDKDGTDDEEGPAYKENTTEDKNGDGVDYKDNMFYAEDATVYEGIVEYIEDSQTKIKTSATATFDKVGDEVGTHKGILETAGDSTKTDEFYIVFKVNFKEFNDYVDNNEPEPDNDDFEYKEETELETDSYMQYLKEFDFEIDINFVQVD